MKDSVSFRKTLASGCSAKSQLMCEKLRKSCPPLRWALAPRLICPTTWWLHNSSPALEFAAPGSWARRADALSPRLTIRIRNGGGLREASKGAGRQEKPENLGHILSKNSGTEFSTIFR